MRAAVFTLLIAVSPLRADGEISGRAVWVGAVPTVAPIRGERLRPQALGSDPFDRPNPHAPRIDNSGGVAGVVIALESAAPTRTWPFPPVEIELIDDGRPMVRQDGPQLVGFVRRGDTVTARSRQPDTFHALRARGAAFFTWTLPDADRPRARALDQAGWVELSNAAGFPAARGYLLVSDHPLLARTDAAGRFLLRGVPAGSHTLTAWMPDWRIERTERDPEMGVTVRVVYRPALTRTATVTVADGQSVGDVEFRFAAE